MLVDRTPQQVRFAAKRDEHLVEVPRATVICAIALVECYKMPDSRKVGYLRNDG